MSSLATSIATGLVVGLVTAVVSAILTARMALQRFQAEQWWTRKASAYVDILAALFKLKAYADARFTSTYSAEVLSVEDTDRLRRASREGYEELLRASAVGALFISSNARTHVEKTLPLARSATLPESYNAIEEIQSEVDASIEILRCLAHDDLQKRWQGQRLSQR